MIGTGNFPQSSLVQYAWLIESSHDGQTWRPAVHPHHPDQGSGGIEWTVGAQRLAQGTLSYWLDACRQGRGEPTWLRVTTWDVVAAVGATGNQPPHLPADTDIAAREYGRYLRRHGAIPCAVVVSTPDGRDDRNGHGAANSVT